MHVLNEASRELPFTTATEKVKNEELRLRYRYLDLRRAKLQRNLVARSAIVSALREVRIERWRAGTANSCAAWRCAAASSHVVRRSESLSACVSVCPFCSRFWVAILWRSRHLRSSSPHLKGQKSSLCRRDPHQMGHLVATPSCRAHSSISRCLWPVRSSRPLSLCAASQHSDRYPPPCTCRWDRPLLSACPMLPR